jgi:hypothetical protein
MKDNLLIESVALPNAANTANTTGLLLPQQAVRPFTNDIRVQLTTTAGTGANNKNITITLQASNEAAANYAAISELATLVINEETSAYPATTREVTLPPNLNKLYIRASAVGEANGGDASDGDLTISIIG